MHLEVERRRVLRQRLPHAVESGELHAFDVDLDEVRRREAVSSNIVVEAHHLSRGGTGESRRPFDLLAHPGITAGSTLHQLVGNERD